MLIVYALAGFGAAVLVCWLVLIIATLFRGFAAIDHVAMDEPRTTTPAPLPGYPCPYCAREFRTVYHLSWHLDRCIVRAADAVVQEHWR